MREEWQERRDNSKTYLFDSMTPELKSHMEDIRLGRKKKKNYNKNICPHCRHISQK